MPKRLLFISPRFLFPTDSGGKIRTTQILRGMKGGAFEIVLASPAPIGARERFAASLAEVCDRFVSWPEPVRGRLFPLTRLRHLLSSLPVPVATDRSAAGRDAIAAELASRPDVVVFDFIHSVVLGPEELSVPSVMFTHNLEAEIFERHAKIAGDPLRRAVWRDQFRKMRSLERDALRRFDATVAVSQRDADYFRHSYGVANVRTIPTAVDVDYFSYVPPRRDPRIVYVGSMDSMANIDAMHFFMDDIWPLIAVQRPDAAMSVIGRAPPKALVDKAKSLGLPWTFTGFVDDVRPRAAGAAVNVVPLRVGGGTRIKVFEGMALGTPIVSTTIGVEGLDIVPDEHYLLADEPAAFAQAVLTLLSDEARGTALAAAARAHVVANFTAGVAARTFEKICLDVLANR